MRFATLVLFGFLTVSLIAGPPTRKFPTEATTEDKTAADLQRVASRANDLGEQVDGVGLALVETEDQLRDEIRKLRDDLTEVQRELTQIREEHAKLWILMHTPPVVEGEANPVKEFMQAKQPEVYWFSPEPSTWFRCLACEQFNKAAEGKKLPFNLVHGFIADEAESKSLGIPKEATFPVFKIPDKAGQYWWLYSANKVAPTPGWVAAEFERRNK